MADTGLGDNSLALATPNPPLHFLRIYLQPQAHAGDFFLDADDPQCHDIS
ncbi:conserved protein of unknown function [Limnospira indica PCC 8005]|uniref:Uncharacterized protein n=1 Tax=Limnospira indica PCC 8005 TaxID=376219 RepID=A0A9P1P0X4_9CYAN|nr:conserved protein of unknown function [Limnospira indica PCC 8005]